MFISADELKNQISFASFQLDSSLLDEKFDVGHITVVKEKDANGKINPLASMMLSKAHMLLTAGGKTGITYIGSPRFVRNMGGLLEFDIKREPMNANVRLGVKARGIEVEDTFFAYDAKSDHYAIVHATFMLEGHAFKMTSESYLASAKLHDRDYRFIQGGSEALNRIVQGRSSDCFNEGVLRNVFSPVLKRDLEIIKNLSLGRMKLLDIKLNTTSKGLWEVCQNGVIAVLDDLENQKAVIRENGYMSARQRAYARSHQVKNTSYPPK